MFVSLAIAPLLLVILARRQLKPAKERLLAHVGAVCPVVDVVDCFVTNIVASKSGDGPASFQGSPLAFFDLTFSSISSEITSFFAASFASSCAILASFPSSVFRRAVTGR